MKKNGNKKWNIIIPLGISIILCVYLIVSMVIAITKPSKQYIINTVGELDAKTTYELFEKEDRSTPIEFEDYLFYGESLNLYFGEYVQNNVPSSLNKMTVKFVDWLNEENTITFNEMSKKVDDGLDLSKLTDGFYSVYLQDGELLQRLYFEKELNVSFYTVTRNNERKLVKLICDPEYFHVSESENEQTILDKAYLYVEVSSVTASNNMYDIVISVDPALTTNQISPVGYIENGITEKTELLDLAAKIKTQLEAKGLKVLVVYCSVDNNNHKNDVLFYKTDGAESASVLKQIYDSKAKYMIHLDFDETSNAGFVHYSNYASDKFANKVFEALQQANLNGSIECCKLSNDNDYAYEIRETGGKALSAATYSSSAMKNDFAYNNRFGVNTIEISYGSILNGARMQNYFNNKEALANKTAQGILNYLNID